MTRLLAVIAMFASAMLFGEYSGHRIELSNPDGFYKAGDTALCHVTLCEEGKPLEGTSARATIYWEGKAVKTQDFATTGKPVDFTYASDKPGWAYFRFEILGDDGKPLSGKGVFKHWAKPSTTAEAGVLFSADEIRTASKRPADFDAFWSERRAKLDKLPITPTYTRLPDPSPDVRLFTVEIPCLGDFPVSGYLAIPTDAKPQSCPAYVDWASWMASDTDRNYAISRAKRGAIGFTPTWHGRPCNMPKEYYNYGTTIKIAGGTVGIEDREKWCFSGMFYRVMRSLDFVKSLPEWDGKTLVSVGGSLGGAQSVAAAALDKDVTTAVVNVPCFCEFDGWASGRKSSIPHIHLADRILAGDRRPLEAGAYFDCVNFAPMIKCEIYVCTGFSDELCPPSNVFAFYNAIPADVKKMMSTSPFTGHYGTTANPKAAKRLAELQGVTRVFKYDVETNKNDIKARPISNFTDNGIPVLVPRVQKYASAEGTLKIERLTVSVPDGEDVVVEQIAEALKRFPSVSVEAAKQNAICKFSLDKDVSGKRNSQGYILTVDANGITVTSPSADGLFNGAQTLRNLLRNIPAPELAACTIEDWPDLDRRGYFMTIAKLPPENLPLLKRTIDTLASLKMNWLLLELGESFPYTDNPFTKRQNAFSREQLVDLLEFCRRRHIRVTPTLQVWSHAAWMTYHPEWDKMTEGKPVRHWESQPCPESELAVHLTEKAINEHIDLFKSDDFFLMMDEFYRGPFHSCEKCRPKDPSQQFKELVSRFDGLVLKRGLTPIVCHDSFINQPLSNWNFGDKLRGDLAPSTEILWWNYNDNLPEMLIAPFSGFKLIGHSLACKPFNTYNMVRLVKKYNGNASTLVYWYESASNGLLSILEKETAASLGGFANGADYLWKYPDTPYSEFGYDGTFEMVRRLYPEKAVAEPSTDTAAPIPLEHAVNAELSASGKFPRFATDSEVASLQAALNALPERFHLATSQGGKYYGMRLAGEASQFPSREGFRVELGNRCIRRLAFLTTCSRPANMRLYAGAGYGGKNLFTFPMVAAITVEYADGGSVRIPLKYRWSIADWNRPFGGADMRWAVRGVDADNNYYSFGICDFVNPEPNRQIKSFHFGTLKFGGISPVILAVSAFGADRPFSNPAMVSPETVAKRIGVTDSPDAGLRVVYGFEDGMGGLSVSAPEPLLQNVKYEIVSDRTSPSGGKVLKITVPAGNYRGEARDGGFIRLDLNMPYSVAKDTKALVIDHKIVTSAKGFSHANNYFIDRVSVFADPEACFRANKLAVNGKWTRDIIATPYVAEGNAPLLLKNLADTKYRKVSFFFHEIDAPVEIYIDTIGDTCVEMSSMPLWKVGTEAEPM